MVGVASESGLVVVTMADDRPALAPELLALLDERQAAGKQLFFLERPPHGGTASLVLSLDNVHDFAALRRDVAARSAAGSTGARE